ncbi:3'(2'),5'-bisphosphate nucleotidase [Tepidamorphus gemmatus]|uniref:3'(2'),5'-bisphosphate nucleotidase CysQ n=2 Tax=Tepidamorphus gemmatus TaxID=747076 RepID=A0A4R3MLS2_9HYPH|nr:3'(2'),5'-bisphosphate nucleotidase [Tepidamorphus gemmatus]
MQDQMTGRAAALPTTRALALAAIALEAGAAILDVYASDFAVGHKDDASPVTEADARAEAIILKRLAEYQPDVPVIAEEAASAGQVPAVGDRFFLVDPLDGTKEFVRRNGEFTVNIALIEAGVPVAGVVYAPALGMMAVGDRQHGAFEATLTPDTDVRQVRWRPLRTRDVPAAGPVAVASRSHRGEETEAFLARHGVVDTTSAGSSLKFVLVARGVADLYPRLGRTMEWDTAAGQAVLEAAGGIVLTLDGAPLGYAKRERGFDNPHFVAWGRPPAA